MYTSGNIQLRRSKRLQENNEQPPKKKDYVEHMHTLHGIASDLHDMTDSLDVNDLKK